MFYLLLPTLETRTTFIDALKRDSITSVFHYIPLHSSPAGQSFGRASGKMTNTDRAGECLARLPLWLGLEEHQHRVIERVLTAIDRAVL